ncbi:MAG: prepilin-type N-terminal cleavage/methylation protein [Paucimonas sp.]|jgi:type IV fimbrial biogenesis protein FimT|nr:prepilin-type N-terminal cleavage/methylation protein [Paucimonas sp.]
MRRFGFSLTELMVALAVVSILTALGAPAFSDLIRNQRLTAAANDFMASVNLARSTAMQQGARTDLVPADGRSWEKGWIILIDANNNQRPDKGERVVFSHGPVAEDIRVTSAFTDSSKKYLSYNSSGRSRTNTSDYSTQSGTMSFQLGPHIRRIKINFLGRPRICNPVNDNTCTGIVDAK